MDDVVFAGTSGRPALEGRVTLTIDKRDGALPIERPRSPAAAAFRTGRASTRSTETNAGR